MKVQKLFLKGIVLAVVMVFKTQAAGKEIIIQAGNTVIYSDGSQSAPGAYRAKQDLRGLWKGHDALIDSIVGAKTPEERLHILRQHKATIQQLAGVSPQFNSALRPPVAARPARRPSGGAPARAESPSHGVDEEGARAREVPLDEKTAATRIQARVRGFQVRQRAERGDYETDPEMRAARKEYAAAKKHYRREKDRFYATMFDAVDDHSGVLHAMDKEQRGRLVEEGMPLVRDLRHYDEVRDEIEGERADRADRPHSGRRDGEAAAARHRSPSPARRAKSPAPMSVDWQELKAFMTEHKANPEAGLKGLTDQRQVRRLCQAILDPEFYGQAKSVGIGTIKSSRMVSFCQGYMPEQAHIKEIKQGEKAKAPEREQVKLRPVELPSQKASMEDQQQGLEAARQALLENARRLGREAEIKSQLEAIHKLLARAQENYDNLTLAIVIMKQDLPEVQGFEGFSRDHAGDLPEVYINHLNYFLDNEGRQLAITRTSEKQIREAHGLLAQAKDNLMSARYDLERINRELLQSTK